MRDENKLKKELDFLINRRKDDKTRIKDIVFKLHYNRDGPTPEVFPYKKILREHFGYVI